MQLIILLICQLKMICRECNIEINIGNSSPDFKLREHDRKLHCSLLEKSTTCLGNLFNGLHCMNEC